MLNDVVRKWSRGMALVTLAVSLITLAAPGNSSAYIGDESVQKPPTSGSYAYGVYGPNETDFPKIGPIYNTSGTSGADPVFAGKVRRITNDFPKPSRSDIYSKNGFWSADGTLMYHHTPSETKTIIDTRTGASVNVPGDYNGFDGSFAPNDPPGGPYTWYFFSGTRLMKYSISTVNGGTSFAVAGPTAVFDEEDFGEGVTLGGLGGSVDWIDNSGQRMVLNVNGVVKVWGGTKFYQNVETVDASVVVANGGWIGISPDGNYVVVSTEDSSGSDQQISYKINHSAATVQAGKVFWTLCGGHGDLVSAGDDRTYLVTFDCYGSRFDDLLPAIYAVDVDPERAVSASNDPDSEVDEAGRNAQRSSNTMLFKTAWGDDGHFSGVSKGALRDWAFISIESGEDTFGRVVDGSKRNPEWWTRPYMQEIVMVNVVDGQVLRVAHHRSRSVFDSYYYQPRVSASWGDCDGVTAGWLSNFGQLQKNKQGRLMKQPYAGYADIYAVDVTAVDVTADPAIACLP